MRLIKNHKRKSGFTIIEMIIVIAVMAIIGAVAVPSLSGVKDSVAIKADNESCETIERTTKIVLADKDLSAVNANYVVMINKENGVVSVTPGTGGTSDIAAELQKCLADIKKPQEKNKTGFAISITNSQITVDVISV